MRPFFWLKFAIYPFDRCDSKEALASKLSPSNVLHFIKLNLALSTQRKFTLTSSGLDRGT
jgi:hypothetical protein